MRISTNQMTSSGLREMLARQAELQHTQIQLATSRRVIHPSDDPVAMTSISALSVEISRLDQFNANADAATNSNQLEESVLSSTTSLLFRVRDLMVQSVNGVYSNAELVAIKEEMSERLDELMGLANTRNAQGEYLFSGSKTDTQAFVKDATGQVIYQGDQSVRALQVSSSVTTEISDSGFDVFVNVKNGNGHFYTTANSANTGSGVIGPGSYQAPPNFVPEGYTVTFGTDINGNTTYTITGNTSGATVVPATVWQEGADISFSSSVAGYNSGQITVGMDGTPQAGDSFQILPSVSQDIFTTIQHAIAALDGFSDSDAGRAKMLVAINEAQDSLDRNMQNIDRIRSRLGARLNAIDSEKNTNLNLLLTAKTSLSEVRDLDVVEASTRLSQQLTVLEAAQASFVRVQDLNLFNFLR